MIEVVHNNDVDEEMDGGCLGDSYNFRDAHDRHVLRCRSDDPYTGYTRDGVGSCRRNCHRNYIFRLEDLGHTLGVDFDHFANNLCHTSRHYDPYL